MDKEQEEELTTAVSVLVDIMRRDREESEMREEEEPHIMRRDGEESGMREEQEAKQEEQNLESMWEDIPTEIFEKAMSDVNMMERQENEGEQQVNEDQHPSTSMEENMWDDIPTELLDAALVDVALRDDVEIIDPDRWEDIASMLMDYGEEEEDVMNDESVRDVKLSIEEERQNRASELKPECVECKRKFKSFNQLVKHSSVHKKMIKCEECGSQFSSSKFLAHHRQICKGSQPSEQSPDGPSSSSQPSEQSPDEPSSSMPRRKRKAVEAKCHVCGRTFGSFKQLTAHIYEIHHAMPQHCDECGQQFRSSKALAHHRVICNQKQKRKKGQIGRGKRAALQNNAMVETFTPTNTHDILIALKELEPDIIDYLIQQLSKTPIKWYINMKCVFKKMRTDVNGQVSEDKEDIYQASKTYAATTSEDIDEVIPEVFHTISVKFQEFQREGSGWTLDHVVHTEVNTATYEPLVGTSYLELPSGLAGSKSIVNIKNDDNKCFLWSVLAHLHPVQINKHRVSKYKPYEHQLDVTGISFPTKVHEVRIFEKRNNLSINVFGYEEGKIVPVALSKTDTDTKINLLLISNEDKSHYCLITNFNGLMTGRRTKCRTPMYYCFNCLHGFMKEEKLQQHQVDCKLNPTQKLKFPDKTTIKFRGKAKQQTAPFVIYADFECFTSKLDDEKKYQHHVPNSFGYVVVSAVPHLTTPPVIYRGDNVVEVFLEKLMEEEKRIRTILKNPKPLRMSRKDEMNFRKATECSICGEKLGKHRVRDHDHVSGAFRGAAHNECNLQYRLLRQKNKDDEKSYKIPVVFHNLRGYDGHLIMEKLGMYKEKKRVEVIASTLEKYITFSLGNLHFIDSLQFMNASLEKLVGNLAQEGKHKFKNMSRYIPDSEQQDLLLRKGVYPYDYVDEASKLEETSLPPKEKFYSLLTKQNITDADYNHAQNVWQTFNCTTLGDYHDIYLRSDVLQLADVFENFRYVCRQTYGLDPAHYCTAPGLSWDAMLRYTKVELELITDIDMYLMVEKGIRGGVSMISQKYAKANNLYLDEHDDTQPTSYIMYYDANNLYGWAMSQSLPKGNFRWVGEEELKHFDVSQIEKDAEKGYILEVDLEYPPGLHHLHNDYPLAPERKTIPNEQLSPYSQELLEKLDMKGKPTEKLIPNLHDKTKYVVHYHNLQQYIEFGMKLTKIHRAVSFNQSKWLEPYIALNTEKRKAAKNPFEKDFFKLMNNSIFGKTMENLRKRINVKLCTTEKYFKKQVAKPQFQQFKIFNEDLVGVHLKITSLELSKAIYVGLSILDISKTLMYDFHYNYVKTKYPEAKLLFTDTDSLCYHIETNDVYIDMHRNAHLFDTSDYPTNHFLHSTQNKKVLGKMKDETAGVAIQEFVGLRAKMYSMLYDGQEKKTAKGVGRACMRDMKHAQYVQCLFDQCTTAVNFNTIRSHTHQVFSEHVNKVGLSPFDDKRYVLEDGVSTLAHGHCDAKL